MRFANIIGGSQWKESWSGRPSQGRSRLWTSRTHLGDEGNSGLKEIFMIYGWDGIIVYDCMDMILMILTMQAWVWESANWDTDGGVPRIQNHCGVIYITFVSDRDMRNLIDDRAVTLIVVIDEHPPKLPFNLGVKAIWEILYLTEGLPVLPP